MIVNLGQSVTEGQTIEPFFLLHTLPTGIPDYVEPTPLSETRKQKLITVFSSEKKLEAAVNDYCKAPR